MRDTIQLIAVAIKEYMGLQINQWIIIAEGLPERLLFRESVGYGRRVGRRKGRMGSLASHDSNHICQLDTHTRWFVH